MQRDGLSQSESIDRFWCFGRRGLLTKEASGSMRDFQRPYARSETEVAGWKRDDNGTIGLAEAVRRIRPTILIGTSTMAGAFTEEIVRLMAEFVERPVIMPLSNPTALSEAVPDDLIQWTAGRGLIATGSPFAPATYKGITYTIGQANNALVFPGLGLGAIVARAKRMSDGMFAAAAEAVAEQIDATANPPCLLPPVERLRGISERVAVAVVKAAAEENLAQTPVDDPERQVREAMWHPRYRPVVAV
jgi:malate dehydrogenase (oxaloacetate-decarboxylating)